MSNSKKTDDNNNETKLSGHNYDGIEELDNSLPNWWINLFYLTILFSIGYFAYYYLGEGPSLLREYIREKDAIETVALQESLKVKSVSEEDLRALLKKPDRVQSGKAIFQTKCVSCHGAQGEGGIGPNLTDDYWIHGGKMTEIVQTISKGVPDKGMPPWSPMLSQDDIHSLSAYIKSLRGTQPPNAKPPQGVLVSE